MSLLGGEHDLDGDRQATRGVRWALVAILLAGLVIRLGLAFYLPRDDAFLQQLPDQLEYLNLAESLIDQGELVTVDERYAAPQPLRAQRMPGYPAMVAACGANVLTVRIVQSLLDVLTAIAAYGLAKSWLPPRSALVAGAAVMFNPFFAFFSQLVLTEAAFACAVAWGMLLLLRGHLRASWWRSIVGMLLLAGSVYLRPTGAILAVAIAMGVTLVRHDGPRLRWPIPPGLTAIAVVALLLVPWAVRNDRVLQAFVPTTTNGGITLYDGWTLDNTTGGSDQRFVQRMPQLGMMGEVERDRYLRRQAIEAISDNPLRAIVLAGKKVLRTWSPVPLSQGDRPTFWIAGGLYSLTLFGLAITGLLFGRIPFWGKVLLLVPALALTVAHAATVGSLRYRLPADPMLGVLAASAVAAWFQHRASRVALADTVNVDDGDPSGVGGRMESAGSG